MNKPRRHFLGSEKVAILKRHLIDKVPVSGPREEPFLDAAITG
jgi:hypothetical protein